MEKVFRRKNLIKKLQDGIEFGIFNTIIFNNATFSPSEDGNVHIARDDGLGEWDIDIEDISERWLMINCNKARPKKQKQIKKKPRKKKKGDFICTDFMAYLHTQTCMVDGCNEMNIEAHHIFGRQPYRYDNLCIPLCPEHHRGKSFSIHEGNTLAFKQKYTKEYMQKYSLGLFQKWIKEQTFLSKGSVYYQIAEYLEKCDSSFDMAMKKIINNINGME